MSSVADVIEVPERPFESIDRLGVSGQIDAAVRLQLAYLDPVLVAETPDLRSPVSYVVWLQTQPREGERLGEDLHFGVHVRLHDASRGDRLPVGGEMKRIGQYRDHELVIAVDDATATCSAAWWDEDFVEEADAAGKDTSYFRLTQLHKDSPETMAFFARKLPR